MCATIHQVRKFCSESINFKKEGENHRLVQTYQTTSCEWRSVQQTRPQRFVFFCTLTQMLCSQKYFIASKCVVANLKLLSPATTVTTQIYNHTDSLFLFKKIYTPILWLRARRSSNLMMTAMVKHGSVSIVVSIPACHVGDLGSIPRRSGASPSSKMEAVTIAPYLFIAAVPN